MPADGRRSPRAGAAIAASTSAAGTKLTLLGTLALAGTVLALTSCTSTKPAAGPSTTGPPSTATSGPSSPSTGATTATSATGTATSASATPTGNTLTISVSGAGSGTVQLSHVSCAPSTITAGAQPGGSISLARSTGVLTVSGIEPVGSARFTGPPVPTTDRITFHGQATGMSATLQAQC